MSLVVCRACNKGFESQTSFRKHQKQAKRNRKCRQSASFIYISCVEPESGQELQFDHDRDDVGFDPDEDQERISEVDDEDEAEQPSNHNGRKRFINRPEFSRDECEVLCIATRFNLSLKRGRKLLEFATCLEHNGSEIRYQNLEALRNEVLERFQSNPMESIDFYENLDGPQNVQVHFRNLYDLVKEILANPHYADRQYTKYREVRDYYGERIFSTLDTSDIFRIAQERVGPDVSPVLVFLAIDGSVVLKGMNVRPIYGKFFCLA